MKIEHHCAHCCPQSTCTCPLSKPTANDKPAPSVWTDAAFPGIEQARITLGLARGRHRITKDEASAILMVVDSLVQRVETLDAEILRGRAVLGPPCPCCGHYLKAEHRTSWNPVAKDVRYYRLTDTCSPPHECEIWRRDILTNHPAIAEELGLTPKD